MARPPDTAERRPRAKGGAPDDALGGGNVTPRVTQGPDGLGAQPYQVMPPLAEAEYGALKASIAAGYDPAHPVVLDENGTVLDGHHRQQACAELGITAPAVVLPGLTEDQKHDYAVRANLACRHLSQEQKRDLIRAELDRDPARSDREIGRLCGVDHKTVGAVRRGEIPHSTTFGEECARVRRFAAEWGLPADDETCRYVAEHGLLQRAARDYFRAGDCPLPPPDWTWTQDPKRPRGGRTRISAENNRLAYERNRLGLWQVLVELEIGRFLIWCDKAGVDTTGGTTSSTGLLRYPVEDGDPPLPADWTAEDEHHAVLGHLYGWWSTSDELAGAGAP